MDCITGAQDGYGDFLELARSFTRKTILPMFEGDSPDGDLSHMPEIMGKAFEVGLASSPDEGMPGYEYGIWGACAGDSGARLSVLLLSAIASACAGVAMNLHAQGLGSRVVTASARRPESLPARVAAALQEGYGPPGHGTLLDPASHGPEAIATLARPAGAGYVISGRKPFVYGMPETGAFAVFCRMEQGGGWGCFLVPASCPGVTARPIADRTGLRACGLMDLVLTDVVVPAEARIDEGDGLSLVRRMMCLHWLGLSAIAVGNGRGAVLAAMRYASERYQGGALIENHPVVKKLIALSEARVETAHALLLQAADSLQDPARCLSQCAMAKLMSADLCFRAVTDSLQVFGGYGYMEDYRMEKRLRDAAVLKSAGGSANALELFIFETGKEA